MPNELAISLALASLTFCVPAWWICVKLKSKWFAQFFGIAGAAMMMPLLWNAHVFLMEYAKGFYPN